MKCIGPRPDHKPMTARRVVSSALMLAVLAAVSGCGSHRIPRPVAAQSAAVPGQAPISAATAAVGLLTDDLPLLRQEWDLSRAQQRLVTGCMRHLGFGYASSTDPAPAAGTVTDDDASPGQPTTYGVLSSTGQRDPDTEDAYIRQLPPQQRAPYLTALDGPAHAMARTRLPGGGVVTYGTGGCLSRARRQLFGSVAASMRDGYVPQTVGQEFASYLTRYRPYNSALRNWQKCMAASGRPFTSPDAAIESVDALASKKGISPRVLKAAEQAIAGADAACGWRTGIRLRRHEALVHYVQGLPAGVVAALQSIYLTRLRAVREAQQVLTTSPTVRATKAPRR